MPRPKLDREPQIMKALEACVIRQGLAKTSLKDVAEEAGLPRPLVRHFVGNRDEMITKLFDGMISRGEDQLENIHGTDSALSIEKCLDLLFEGVFADETSNALIGELWYLADRDDAIRARLAGLYQRVNDLIVDTLNAEGLGTSNQARTDAAFALVSLSYGDAAFRDIGLRGPSRRAVRAQARAILDTLPNSTPNT